MHTQMDAHSGNVQGSEEQGQSKTGDDDSTQRGIDAMNRGLRSGFEDRLDPTRALSTSPCFSSKKPREKLDYKSFQEYADSLAGQNLEAGQKRSFLLSWLVENDTDGSDYPDAFTREERTKLVDAIMKGKKAEEGLAPKRRPSTFQGGSRRKRRVTRKKRGGWQTPEKLESISRFSPIRRVERKKKTKKHKKNKRKRRRKKQTKRKGRKRN